MRVVTAYVAYGANKGCAKCHEVKSLYSGSTIASQPTSPMLTTIPTGIPKSPRRWFGYSIFDHQSHQEMTCLAVTSVRRPARRPAMFCPLI